MTTVQTNQQVSSSLLAAVNGTSSSSSASSAVTDATNQFMTLLTTQLQNQDPLNPEDNSQITSQLAQLSTVSGINQLNTTVDSLLTNLQTSQSYQAANLVGHDVLVAGNSISLSSSTAASGTGTTSAGYLGVNLPQGANNLTITINDSSGNQVKQITLGTQSAGTLPLSWDGSTDTGTTAPDGNYTFSVKATVSGKSVTATALTYQPVLSVSNSTSGVNLNLGNNTSVSSSSVQEIF